MPSSPNATILVPGEWLVEIQHANLAAVVQVSTPKEPVITYGVGGETIAIRLAHELYVLPVQGLYLLYVSYVPTEDEIGQHHLG